MAGMRNSAKKNTISTYFHRKTGNLEAIPCLGKIASLRNIVVVVVVANKQRCLVSGHLEEEYWNGLE